MSNVLILATCSNHKVESDETVDYQASGRVDEFLSRDLASDLYDARRQIRDLITSDKASRNGIPLKQLPYNQHIVDGLDFRGTIEVGHYLPALQRYDGRFYREIGTPSARSSLAHEIKHHLLIVSGLYGLLTPTELIQCYSCHVPDHPDIAKQWTANDSITAMIIEYIKKFQIVKVFDFMGVDNYRKLISWEMVRHETVNNVLHCYSRQFAGADLLPSLGILARKFLTEKSESELMKITAEQIEKVPNDEIVFLPFPMPGKELAREISEQATIASIADKIGRMRRNIMRFLYVAVAAPKPSNYYDLVNKLQERGHNHDMKAASRMDFFRKTRNRVEYDNLKLSQEQWQNIREGYAAIEKWAKSHDYYQKAKGLEEIEY